LELGVEERGKRLREVKREGFLRVLEAPFKWTTMKGTRGSKRNKDSRLKRCVKDAAEPCVLYATECRFGHLVTSCVLLVGYVVLGVFL
jgi:hypothetical protein